MREVIWIRRLALIGALLALCVVVLGGYTRLSDSGLGCPDWPGCFGHVVPTADAANYVDASAWQKAWAEMRHRYAAELLGLIIVVIAGLSIRARREPGVSVWFAVVFPDPFARLTVAWLQILWLRFFECSNELSTSSNTLSKLSVLGSSVSSWTPLPTWEPSPPLR